MPIASVGNITQGRKRSMGFLKRAAEEVVVAAEPAIPVCVEPELDAPAPHYEANMAIDVAALPPVVEDEAVLEDLELAEPEPPAKPVVELALDPPVTDGATASAEAEPPAFGRVGGLPPPAIGHSETLAEVLRRYRQTGDWR